MKRCQIKEPNLSITVVFSIEIPFANLQRFPLSASPETCDAVFICLWKVILVIGIDAQPKLFTTKFQSVQSETWWDRNCYAVIVFYLLIMDCKLAVLPCPGQGPRPAAADAAIAYYSSCINKPTWVVNKETHKTFDLKIIIHKYITMLWIVQM